MEASTNQIAQRGSFSSSLHGGRIVSFHSGAVNSSAEMISMDMSSSVGTNNMGGIFISSSPGTTNHMAMALPARSFPGTDLHEPLQRLTHVSRLPADWSSRELEILHEGLARYANVQSVKKYIKIAAILPDKTIRDVAWRCQWITNMEMGKRKRAEDHHGAKRTKSVKLVASASASSNNNAPSDNIYPDQLVMHHLNHCSPSTVMDEDMQRRLSENDLTLRQIANNLQNGQMKENAHLFLALRENITDLQHRINMMPETMNRLPGIMQLMPPFPLSINEELLNNIVSLNSNVVYAAYVSNQLQPGLNYFEPSVG